MLFKRRSMKVRYITPWSITVFLLVLLWTSSVLRTSSLLVLLPLAALACWDGKPIRPGKPLELLNNVTPVGVGKEVNKMRYGRRRSYGRRRVVRRGRAGRRSVNRIGFRM